MYNTDYLTDCMNKSVGSLSGCVDHQFGCIPIHLGSLSSFSGCLDILLGKLSIYADCLDSLFECLSGFVSVQT